MRVLLLLPTHFILLFAIFGLMSCRLIDNRIRGSYGPNPKTDSNSDGTPDSFGFVDKNDVALSSSILSEIVPIVGINRKVNIEVLGDGNPQYRVCSDESCVEEIRTWSADPETELISESQFVQLQLTSSASNSTSTQASLKVGTVTANWKVTTSVALALSNKGTWRSLSLGVSHTCGIASNSKAYCWGKDSNGQLGENDDGDNLDEDIPVDVDTSALTPGTSFVSITGGLDHTCGLASDGKAFCWGGDGSGQLGENADGDNLDENIPVAIDISALTPGTSFISLSAGAFHTCGLASDGQAFCWGNDGNGELGENADGDNLSEYIPVLVDKSALSSGASFVAIIAGSGPHSCGLSSNGQAYCWGNDFYGQLGEDADGDNLTEIVPVAVDTSNLDPGASFVSI